MVRSFTGRGLQGGAGGVDGARMGSGFGAVALPCGGCAQEGRDDYRYWGV